MFKWLNKQGVESTKGFIVQSISRFVIEYREDKKCISIEVESDYTPGKLYEKISSSSFLKWNDGTPISLEKRNEIIQNFIEAMNFQGIDVIIN